MNATPIHVLLVEDNAGDARLIMEALADGTSPPLRVKHVERLSHAISMLAEEIIDVILLDLSLPDAHGESTADQLYAAVPDLPIVIITGLNDEEFALRLIGKRVQDYLVKGQVDGPALARSMRYAIERKRTLVALSLSEARYRAIVEDQTDLICRFAPDGTLTFANEAFAVYISQPAEMLMGQNFVSLFSGKDLDALEASLTSLLPENPVSTVEYQVNTLNGDQRWQQWINRAMFDEQGYFTEFQVVGRDITDRKHMEEALCTSEVKFRSIIETTDEWIWTIDTERKLIYNNRAVEKMLGYTVDDLNNQDLLQWLHPDDQAQFEATWAQYLASAQAWNGLVLRWRHKDGSYRYLESNAVPILNTSSELIGFSGAYRDITERREREAEKVKFEVEREHTQLFKRFIGGVPHDLRTPLTIIGTSLDLLYRMTDNDSQLRHLHKIEAQTRHIQSIVEDLFTLLRLESDTVELYLVPLDFNAIVEMICEQPSEARKSHSIQLQLDENILQVMGDQTELKCAVKHLLVNAFNYAAEGSDIVIKTYQDIHEVVLEITDRGIGIPPEEMLLIFDRFYRADKARSIETGGSGLGLTIAKKIVEMHKGHIWAQSVVGTGSTFYVSLPLIAELQL